MPWLLASPGHQHLHQWLSSRLQYLQCVSNGDTADLYQAIDMLLINDYAWYRGPCLSQERVSHTCAFSTLRNGWKCIYIFLFPKLNSAQQWLMHLGFSWVTMKTGIENRYGNPIKPYHICLWETEYFHSTWRHPPPWWRCDHPSLPPRPTRVWWWG